MNDTAAALIVGIVALLVGLFIGWEASALQIKRECDRLGGFWVGSTVYECKKSATKEQQP